MATAENSMSRWRDQPWRCANCQFVLGVVSSDGLSLRIKWRDLFVEIGDAKYVKETCRRCGLPNEIRGDGPRSCEKDQFDSDNGK